MNNRPRISRWSRPQHIHDYRTDPGFDAGHLATANAGWRTFRPVVRLDSRNGCYLLSPDGVIYKQEGKVAIDLDFCKGCGVCFFSCSSTF